MTPEEIKQAIARADEAIARSVRAGQKPDPSDLLLLQHLSPPRTLRDRIYSSAFPLVIVVAAMIVLAILATNRPPVVEMIGEARTTAFDLTFDGASDFATLDRTALNLVGAEAATFRASGFASAWLGNCALDLSDEDLQFEAGRVSLPLGGATRLRMEVARNEASFGGPNPSLSLYLASETDSVVDALGVSDVRPQRSSEACRNSNILTLDPEEPVRIEIAVPRVAAAEFPDFLSSLLRIPVSTADFGAARRPGYPESCALQSAQVTVRQEIAFPRVSASKLITLPPGVCLEIIDGDVDVRPYSDGSFGVRFTSASANIDDGLPADAPTLTYLEILTADPDIGLILSAIAFILTTVWSVAVLLKEILT